MTDEIPPGYHPVTAPSGSEYVVPDHHDCPDEPDAFEVVMLMNEAGRAGQNPEEILALHGLGLLCPGCMADATAWFIARTAYVASVIGLPAEALMFLNHETGEPVRPEDMGELGLQLATAGRASIAAGEEPDPHEGFNRAREFVVPHRDRGPEFMLGVLLAGLQMHMARSQVFNQLQATYRPEPPGAWN